MCLLRAVSEVFLLLGWVWRLDCFCSPTVFYNNCWIRRFPGLTIDLEHSQKRGAQVLKIYSEASARHCSRTCCLLENASCNLAVFHHETNNQNLNCLHVYCPALESCILKPWINVVLYNITPGVDPDLLVFEMLSFKDPNTRSSFNKWERHGNARVADSEKCQDGTSNSPCLPSGASLSTTAEDLITNSSNTGIVLDSIHKTASTTHLRPTAMSSKERFTEAIDKITKEIAKTDNTTALPTSTKMVSHLPSPAHLNSSKQHWNETKGYSGRNHTSNNEGHGLAWDEAEISGWLLPVVLCCLVTLVCCCSLILATGRHQKRSGHYKPKVRTAAGSRQFIRYTVINNSFDGKYSTYNDELNSSCS